MNEQRTRYVSEQAMKAEEDVRNLVAKVALRQTLDAELARARGFTRRLLRGWATKAARRVTGADLYVAQAQMRDLVYDVLHALAEGPRDDD